MDVLSLLFVFVFIAFGFGNLGRIQMQSIAISFLDITLVLLIIVWIVLVTRRKIRFVKSILQKSFLIFTALSALSLFVNSFLLSPEQLFVSSMYLFRWILYVSVYWVLLSMSRSSAKRVEKLLVVVGLMIVGMGYVQMFFYNDLGNLGYIGWDNHLYRMFSTFLDPNFAGCLFVLYLFFVLYKFFYASKEELYKRIFYGIVSALTLFAVIFTYSRTAYVMFIAGSLVMAFVYGYKKFVAIMLILALFLVVSFSNILVEGINPFRKTSTSARINSMQNALLILSKHPIFGVGFNAYRYAQNRYGIRTSPIWQTSHADAGTDNSYLFVLATTGIVGFLGFCNLLYRMYKVVWTKIKKKHPLAFVIASSGVGLLVSAFFLNTLFYPFILLWFVIIFSLMERNEL
ncbi:MAG: O-antigen ligase family protein [Candidatus Levybacteria bacterium]|nr:O-antigen ligase family protein [Candidatus Levybacteria bacterium]